MLVQVQCDADSRQMDGWMVKCVSTQLHWDADSRQMDARVIVILFFQG